MRSDEIDSMLLPSRELINDKHFWQHQSDGLAYFCSSDVTRSYRVPLDLHELLVVTDRFHIKPLLPLISGDGRFYLLVLDLNQTRLFQATKNFISELELKNAPTSLDETMKYDDPEKQLQFHSGTAPAKGRRAAMFHGHGAGSDETDKKKNILRFFHQLDHGVSDLLTDHNAPLMLAGVEYLLPLYREANSYPNLLPNGITENTDEISDQELHEKAWKKIQPYFQQAEKQAAEKYASFADSGLTSVLIQDVVKQSYYKRVESLFVEKGKQLWGVFDKNSAEIRVHEKAEPGDQDLLDLAAVQTFINGGDVFLMEPENMPEGADIAAVYRY